MNFNFLIIFSFIIFFIVKMFELNLSNIDIDYIIRDIKRTLNKGAKLADRNAFPSLAEEAYTYSGNQLNIILFPGVLKAGMVADSWIAFGHPVYENMYFFQRDYLEAPADINGGFDPRSEWDNDKLGYKNWYIFYDDVLRKEVEKAFKLFGIKYNHEYTFYSALPFSFLQSGGAITDVSASAYPILKEHTLFQDWMLNMPDFTRGLIPFYLGVFEGIIGLIPLLERNMVELSVDKSSGQPMYSLNMDDKLTKDVYKMLKPYVTGSVAFSRAFEMIYSNILLYNIVSRAFSSMEIRGEYHRAIADMICYSPEISLREDYQKEIFKLTHIELPSLPEPDNLLGVNLVYDPMDLFTMNYAIKGRYVFPDDPPELKYQGGSHDPRLKEALDNVISKWAGDGEKDFLYNAKPENPVERPELFKDPVYLKKKEILKRICWRDGEEWYKNYWDKVREVKDLIDDRKPKRKLSDDEKKLIITSLGIAYMYFYRFYWFFEGMPLIKAEVKYLADYLKGLGFRFKWRDAIRYGVGNLVWANQLMVVGKRYVNMYGGIGPSTMRKRRRFSLFQRRREKEETDYKFDWMRYERYIDEAKKNLDNFDRFKQLYYLERALHAYEDAESVLYDMMNRYKDERKHREILEKEIILMEQERDLREMLKELKKEKYEP